MDKEALKKEIEATPTDLNKWMSYVKAVVQDVFLKIKNQILTTKLLFRHILQKFVKVMKEF